MGAKAKRADNLQVIRDWPGISSRARIARGIKCGADPIYWQDSFRIRSGDTAGLNADTGWAALENGNATIGYGIIFRIRFHIRETAGKGGATEPIHLQVRHAQGNNDWVDVRAQSQPDGLCPPVLAMPSSQFTDGAACDTELLTNQGDTFVNGVGDTDNVLTTGVDSSESEVEFCLQIMRSYESTLNNLEEVEVNDTLEFRIVRGAIGSQTLFDNYTNTPTVTVAHTDYYLGGTYSESPNQVFWCDGNKNLYAIIEGTETYPELKMMRSTDGGKTWTEQDSANRPSQRDMESFDGVLQNDRIYMAHQESGDDVYHHVYRVSTHATNPDTWETTDEAVTTGIAMNTNPQSVAIARRSDGDLIIFYTKNNGTIDHGYYKIKVSSWGSEQQLDVETDTFCKGITCVVGASDRTHIFYRMVEDATSGNLYHRSLSSADSLDARESCDTVGTSEGDRWCMACPAVYWDDGGDEKIMCVYIDYDDLYLYSVVVTNNGSPESRKSCSDNTCAEDYGSNEQAIAAVGLDGTDIWVFYADGTDLDVYRDKNSNNGNWGTDVEDLDGVTVHWIRGSVFTHKAGNGGKKVFGYVYDNGSAGGTGQIWYNEYEIPTAPTTAVRLQPKKVFEEIGV